MIEFQLIGNEKSLYSPLSFKYIQMLENGDRIWIGDFAYKILYKVFHDTGKLVFKVELA